jgi:hypothetical protein
MMQEKGNATHVTLPQKCANSPQEEPHGGEVPMKSLHEVINSPLHLFPFPK